MVVDLAVDRQYQLAVDRTNGLRAACRVDDGEAFMDQDRALVEVHAAPVGAAVALALRQFQRVAAQCGDVVARLQAEDAEDRTHGRLLVDGCGDTKEKTRTSQCRQIGRASVRERVGEYV